MARREALDNRCRSATCTRRRGKPTRSSKAAVNAYRARMIVSATPRADCSGKISKLTPSIVEGREKLRLYPTQPVLGRIRAVARIHYQVEPRRRPRPRPAAILSLSVAAPPVRANPHRNKPVRQLVFSRLRRPDREPRREDPG